MNAWLKTAAAILLSASLANVTAVNQSDAEIMARMMWGECRGAPSTMEKAAVAWCVLNRVDSDKYPDTIRGVITQPNQFTGYRPSNPVDPELLWIAQDVITRWQTDGEGRVLPETYIYFVAGGGCNKFSEVWPVGRKVWDWSAEDPYKEEKENDDPADHVEGLDEHDEPADESDRLHAYLRRCYGRFDDGWMD